MEILWLVIGILIGMLIVWWFLSNRCKSQLEEMEAKLGNTRRQVEQGLEQERRAHDTTRGRLAEAEKTESSASARAASLKGDLIEARSELDNLKSRNTAAESQHRRIESDMRQLESRLNEADRQNTELAGKLEQTRASHEQVEDTNRSRISDLERRIGEQDSEIARLQAERDAARSRTDNSTPAAASYAERTAPTYGLTNEPSFQATADPTPQTEDLTKIKGIGRVLQGKLHQLGITTFQQIADFTQADIERVDAVLDFPGRIEREQWVAQARAIVGDTRSN